MVGFSACMTKKKLARLKEDYQIFRTNMDSLGAVEKWEERKFRPGDKIFISINTQSLNTDQVSLFGAGRETLYTVADDSSITLPLIGSINACQYNRPQLTNLIKTKVAYFIKDPFVLIKPVQIQVKVLGEAARQGDLTLDQNDATLSSVLAQVGGVSQFARRDSITVIRESEGLRKTYYVDIRDGKSFFNSPVYRLQQNDIIIVKPNDYVFRVKRNEESFVNIQKIANLNTIAGILLFTIPIYTIFFRR